MSVHPRDPQRLSMLNIADPQWLPEDVRPLAAEALRLRAALADAERDLGHLEKASTRDHANTEERRQSAQAAREGKAPPKIGPVAKHDAELLAATQARAGLRLAMQEAVAEYDLALRASLSTSLPAAEADYDAAEVDYENAVQALEAARSRWLIRQRVLAMWVGLSLDPEGASVSLNTQATTRGQTVRIGNREIHAEDLAAAPRAEMVKARQTMDRARGRALPNTEPVSMASLETSTPRRSERLTVGKG